MSFNKKILKNHLLNKNYSLCIHILYEEIKKILIAFVREYDENFQYSNLTNLKNKCLDYLDYEQNLLMIEFFDLSMNPRNELYELNQLLEIYNKLK